MPILRIVLIAIILYPLIVWFVIGLVTHGLHWLKWKRPVNWIVQFLLLITIPGIALVEWYEQHGYYKIRKLLKIRTNKNVYIRSKDL